MPRPATTDSLRVQVAVIYYSGPCQPALDKLLIGFRYGESGITVVPREKTLHDILEIYISRRRAGRWNRRGAQNSAEHEAWCCLPLACWGPYCTKVLWRSQNIGQRSLSEACARLDGSISGCFACPCQRAIFPSTMTSFLVGDIASTLQPLYCL